MEQIGPCDVPWAVLLRRDSSVALCRMFESFGFYEEVEEAKEEEKR